MAQLCVTIGAPTLADLRERRDLAAPGADLVELRLDTVADPDAAGAVAGRTRPVIVTCRASWEGGHFRGSEETRLRLLHDAWLAGAEYVDIEFAALPNAAWVKTTRGHRLIVSAHDFDGVPSDLSGRHRALCATGAEVAKLAITAHGLRDAARLATLPRRADGKQVLLAMGAPGLVTRIAPGRFGSEWTYAGDAWAPGQVPASRLRDEFRFGEVSDRAALYGVAARPSGHSMSPVMHNAAFRAAGLDAVYIPLEALDAADLFDFAAALDLQGASVTIPFKTEVLPRCEPDAAARAAGAVNTLVHRDGRWLGRNTDIAGLLAPLTGRFALAGARVTILGAGGAARAAAIACAGEGATVTVSARRVQQARDVAHAAGVSVGTFPPERGSWDLLINTTPVGMHPLTDATPVPASHLGGRFVYDLIYNPGDTRLLREARESGLETLGGLDMLVAQAEAQFEIWTGQPPAPGVMRAAAGQQLRTLGAAEQTAPTVSRS
jgi:3-dehydroquinate dehydratase / shikimate dehydrogenase